MSDILQVQGINSKGFGIVPKLVMQDRRLTAEAKAIYSYFCSYAGAGQTAFPSRSKIVFDLGMSIKRYYKHFNLLKEYGYIGVQQEKSETGQFKRNLYTLLQIIPCTQNEPTEKEESPCSHFPCTQKPYTQNEYNNNNRIKSNSFNSNSQSSPSEKKDNDEDETDVTAKRIDDMFERIKENIDYSDFELDRPNDISLINEIIDIMIDAIMSTSKHVRIDGEDKPRELVRNVLLKLGYEHIDHVVEQFKDFTGRVNKKRQFILTMLYNSKMELDSHYTNLVSYHMHK